MKITSLTINNQNLKLVYDFNVLCDCEGPTNRNLLVALARQGSNSASELRWNSAALWSIFRALPLSN